MKNGLIILLTFNAYRRFLRTYAKYLSLPLLILSAVLTFCCEFNSKYQLPRVLISSARSNFANQKSPVRQASAAPSDLSKRLLWRKTCARDVQFGNAPPFWLNNWYFSAVNDYWKKYMHLVARLSQLHRCNIYTWIVAIYSSTVFIFFSIVCHSVVNRIIPWCDIWITDRLWKYHIRRCWTTKMFLISLSIYID